MTETVRKSVIYRSFKAVSGVWPAGTLEQLSAFALDRDGPNGLKLRDDWRARQFSCAEVPGHFRFSYALEYSDGALFGMVCLYSPDEYMAMIRENSGDRSASEKHIPLDEYMRLVEIAELEPPEGENYLKGHAYFLIRGNHVFIVQNTSVRASSIQQYFYDLLRSVKIINDSHTFILDPLLTLSGDSAIGDIKAVEVGGVPTVPPIEEEKLVLTEREEHHEIGRAAPAKAKGRQILDLIFGSTRADEIMDAVPHEAELEVDVKFGFRSRKRKLNRAALSEIASAARDLPEGQVRAIGRDGKATGDDIRLQTDMPFRRLRPNGALLDLSHAREQLLRVYARFVEDDKIDP